MKGSGISSLVEVQEGVGNSLSLRSVEGGGGGGGGLGKVFNCGL